MAGVAKQVYFDIDEQILTRFNQRYAPAARSAIIERLMEKALDAPLAEAIAAAKKIASDPDYREYDEVAEWTDAQSADTLSRF